MSEGVALCGNCWQYYSIGDWPFCPHGRPLVGFSIIDDRLEGGPRHFETMGHDAPYIETKSQWRREVAARGLVNVDKHDRAFYDRMFRQHDERLRDMGRTED